MNRIKKISLQMVVMVGMTLAMSSLGLAQQETMPDEFRSADEIAAQVAAQSKNTNNDQGKTKVQVADSKQSKSRKQKQLAKRNDSQQQATIIARK